MRLKGLEPQWIEFGGGKFQIKPLTWAETLELGVLISDDENLVKGFTFACEKALVGWDGVEDENGPVKFSHKAADMLPIDAVAAIAKEVIDANILGAAAEKN